MMHKIKQSFVAFLMVVVMAPGFYFGVAPTKEAHAVNAVESVVNVAKAALACYASDIIRTAFNNGMFGGIGSFFGGSSGGFGSGGGGGGGMSSVPVWEKNTSLLNNINDMQQTNSSISKSNADMLFKECVLDPLAWEAKNIFIEDIMGEMLDWADEGFLGPNGEIPVFLSDPRDFFRNVATRQIDDFLFTGNIDDHVCDSFDTTIIQSISDIANQSSYGVGEEKSCGHEDIFGLSAGDSRDAYDSIALDGNVDFANGGLGNAMELAFGSNNPYGAFFELQTETAKETAMAVGTEAQMLDYGDGFFSTGCGLGATNDPAYCNPGQLISSQIDDWMGGGLTQLENADELTEIISAIIGNLVNEMFTESDYSATSSHDGMFNSGSGSTGYGF